ncbi:facilitated trehalose transporter Tret1-like isoform X2 [Aricia agestis]|uniref:facilitated trehalose transporter Tret1-like isoform X2 n=1 Tax=Aricia agestis TaxID=91739 RepID=UPI001C205D14|nr:facilitated trehalose transporter Tret1-like isoform X2 [Aricia agestis]
MQEENVSVTAFLVQGFSAMSIAFLTSLTGFIYAWPSYTMEMFRSNATVLSEPMTMTDVSLLGSLTNVGGLLATPFCGYAMDKFGRKYTAMLFGMPCMITWAIIAVSKSVNVILFAVALAGLSAGGQAVSSVYISEISQDSIRGALTSTTVSGYFLGLLFSYVLGGYLPYHYVIYTHLLFCVLYVLMVGVLKESPVYLMMRGKEEEAKESLAFYRRVDKNSKAIEVALKKIKLQIDPRIAMIQEGDDVEVTKELLENPPPVEVKESAWKFLSKSESSKRALVTVIIIMGSVILMGSIVLQVYAEPLFKEAVPTMDPNTCCVLLAVVYLIASIICAFTIDRFGRKPLMVITAAASGFFNILLGTQLHLRWAPHWFTAVVIYAYSLVYNLGVAIVPFVLTAEVFLPEVRGIGNSFSMACMWVMNFVTLIIFNPLVEACGLGPTFYVFSVVCFLTAIYSQFCLPETKGLSADEIQILFVKKRKTRNEVKA